jgi:hypothetical protein
VISPVALVARLLAGKLVAAVSSLGASEAGGAVEVFPPLQAPKTLHNSRRSSAWLNFWGVVFDIYLGSILNFYIVEQLNEEEVCVSKAYCDYKKASDKG